ncbi:hypothetical protein MRX96_012705 [Rhipicephalus microplus]
MLRLLSVRSHNFVVCRVLKGNLLVAGLVSQNARARQVMIECTGLISGSVRTDRGFFPDQLLKERGLQTLLPVLPERLLSALPNHDEFKAQNTAGKLQQAKDYIRRHSATPLIPLSIEEDVWIKDLGCSGRVLSPAQRPSSYVVDTPSGVVKKNSCRLVPFVGDQNAQGQPTMVSSPTQGTLPSSPPRASSSTSAPEASSPRTSCASPVRPVKMPPLPEVQTLPVQASVPQCGEPKRTPCDPAMKPPRRLNM